MAKGQAAKQQVMAILSSTFADNSFIYNGGKELRINTSEDGKPIQIKVTLTVANTIVSEGEDTALPGAKTTATTETVSQPADKPKLEVSAEEKDRLQQMVDFLNL